MRSKSISNLLSILMCLFFFICITYSEPKAAKSNQGTVAMWHFDENWGDTAFDSSTYNNHGIIHGAMWTEDGMFGTALEFDGVNDYIRVSDEQSLDLIDELTVEAWIKGNGAGFSAMERSLPENIPAGLPKIKVVGDTIYYAFNTEAKNYNLCTAITDIDGSGWTLRQHTNNLRWDCQIEHQVVGEKIYFVWRTTREWYGAQMNLDGTGYFERILSTEDHNHW